MVNSKKSIQRGNLVSYFQPDSRAFTINSGEIVDALPAVIRTDFSKLSQNYDFIKLGKDRIAGRFVDTIRIVPKDDFRYQYLVFLDEENGLLLRGDMLDREGKLLDQFRVVTLYIDDRLRGLTDYLNKVSMPPLLSEGKQESSLSINWKTDWLPQGFDLIRQNQDVMDGEVIEMRYLVMVFLLSRFMLTKLTVPMQKKTRGNKGLTRFTVKSWAIKKLPLSDSFQLPQRNELCKA